MDLFSFAILHTFIEALTTLRALLRWQGRVRVSLELDSRSGPEGPRAQTEERAARATKTASVDPPTRTK